MKSSQYLLLEEHSLTVQSGKLKIKNIQIFDFLEKKTTKPNSLIIVKATLENNSEETRKIIY
jgi:hypothetical protein